MLGRGALQAYQEAVGEVAACEAGGDCSLVPPTPRVQAFQGEVMGRCWEEVHCGAVMESTGLEAGGARSLVPPAPRVQGGAQEGMGGVWGLRSAEQHWPISGSALMCRCCILTPVCRAGAGWFSLTCRCFCHNQSLFPSCTSTPQTVI